MNRLAIIPLALLILSVDCSTAKGEDLSETVRFLSSLGSRISGYPGAEVAADFVEAELRAIGVADITREPFEITVPMDKGGELTLTESGERFTLYGMWPNLVRTPTLPPGGYLGELIYGGAGEWANYKGQELKGRLVLMEFNIVRLPFGSSAVQVPF